MITCYQSSSHRVILQMKAKLPTQWEVWIRTMRRLRPRMKFPKYTTLFPDGMFFLTCSPFPPLCRLAVSPPPPHPRTHTLCFPRCCHFWGTLSDFHSMGLAAPILCFFNLLFTTFLWHLPPSYCLHLSLCPVSKVLWSLEPDVTTLSTPTIALNT